MDLKNSKKFSAKILLFGEYLVLHNGSGLALPYHEYSLYRGNRSSKVSANHFEAFDSPNYSPSAVAGVDIELNLQKLYRSTKTKLEIFTALNPNVGLIKLFQGYQVV